MSKLEIDIRRATIINYLKNPKSLKQIFAKLEEKSYNDDMNYTICNKTFKRDIDNIKKLYNIDIIYNHSDNTYKAVMENEDVDKRRILLAKIENMEILSFSEKYSDFIQLEKKTFQKTEEFSKILKSIKESRKIKFTYRKESLNSKTQRFTEPYFLKEHKNRWYLVAKDLYDKNQTIKTFALDLITDIEIINEKFKRPNIKEVKNKFKDYFGINTYPGGDAVDIRLSFRDPEKYYNKVDYVEATPLHHSQEIESKTETELILKLKLFPTIDFKMELLSFGNKVKVLEPKWLAKDIVKMHQEAIDSY
jgi:predicted DNA-binding transcriptional regulator YafY